MIFDSQPPIHGFPQTSCPGCCALFPDVDGPTHAHIGASPGCWKVYGEVLAKEFTDPQYFLVHRLTVDTYAAQHPGVPGRRSAQSVTVHLVALYLILEKELDSNFVTKKLGQLIRQKNKQFEWLTPPQDLGDVTIADVWKAKDATEHVELVHQWAGSVWTAWREHHKTIDLFYED
jgi:hypothetical protein